MYLAKVYVNFRLQLYVLALIFWTNLTWKPSAMWHCTWSWAKLSVKISRHFGVTFTTSSLVFPLSHQDHNEEVTCVSFNGNDSYIASGSTSGDIILHSITTNLSSKAFGHGTNQVSVLFARTQLTLTMALLLKLSPFEFNHSLTASLWLQSDAVVWG